MAEPTIVDGVDYSEVSPELAALVETKHAQAVADEPAATAALQEALAGFDGGRLEGLDYRFKGVEGIGGKVRRKQLEQIKRGKVPDSDEAGVDAIGDALRYTAILPVDRFGDAGQDMLATLENAGFTVEWGNIKNFWAKGDDYSGTNVKVTTPSGIPMELQFHTQESYDTKSAIHGLYELSRDAKADDLARLEAFDEMVAMWEAVEIPAGAEELGDLRAASPTPDGLELYRRTTELGLKYDPTAKAAVDPVRLMDERGEIDWGEETVIPVDELASISMSESWLKKVIERTDDPDFEFREDYPVKLYRDPNGELHVVDGNTRIAMRLRLGQDVPVVIYDGPVEREPAVQSMGAEARAELTLDPFQRQLRAAGKAWAKERGLRDFGSDATAAPAERALLSRAAAELPPDPSPERFAALDEMLSGGAGAALGGKALHNGLGPNGDGYVAARAAVHREMVAEFEEAAEAAGIPKERRALMTAGLAGSGKTFSLNPGQAASDLDVVVWDPSKSATPPEGATHVAISADYVKQRLAELGLNPGIPGLRPMEEAAIMHPESGDIARLIEQQMLAAGFNVVLDGTLRDELQVRKQLDLLQRNGYDRPDLVGADISVEESQRNAVGRYMEEAAANPEMGGRFVPTSAASAYASKMDRLSLPRDNMDHLIVEGKFNRAVIVNNEGVSNFNADTIDDVDASFPLPAAAAERLRGGMDAAEWQAELDRRGITVADGFGRVVGRAEGGKWSEYEGTPLQEGDVGPGGYPPRSAERVALMPGVGGGSGTKADPFKVTDVNTAAILLLEGEHFIELDQERKVALLVDKVSELVDDAKSNQRKVATYDLCKVTVPGTNLFCAENKGYPRIEMPQLSTDKPTPGSFADRQPRSVWTQPDGSTFQSNDVDLVPHYLKFLDEQGIEYADASVRADELKATQSELTGSKIVRNLSRRRAELAADPDSPGRRILVTRDGYILDGHHGWATNVAISIGDGRPTQQAVTVIDADILDILDRTVKWATEAGSPSQGAAMPAAPMEAPVADGGGAAVAASLGSRSRRRGVRGLPHGSTRACYTC